MSVLEEVFKKCSFCKMKFRISALKEYDKSDFLKIGLIHVCKVCDKKNNVKNYQSKTSDNRLISYIRYRNKKYHGVEASEKLIELQLLQIKLKREIKK
jgi:hypothetical protein